MNVFIDTNILAYAYDLSEPIKREKCLNILKEVFSGEKRAFISSQILGELFYTLVKNFRKPLDKEKARIVIGSFVNSPNWIKLDYNSSTIEKAIILSKEYSLPFWDCLIAATMLENNIFTIYTENESDFRKIPGIKVLNPL